MFSSHKVDNPCLATFLIRTPIYSGLGWLQEWILERHVFKRDQIVAKNMITILGLVVFISGGIYMII